MTAATFTITTSRTLPGARLSLAGQWGNMPFADVETAESEARRIGGPGAVIRWARSR